MTLFHKINGIMTKMSGEAIVTPKDDMIREHEELVALLEKTIADLKAENDKQRKELEGYRKQ